MGDFRICIYLNVVILFYKLVTFNMK
ncbi:hypothetical protein TorRG33x02_158850 [Trema orientale]|uniref:Uncharacterized protein n=1 Tax=Trema orientale TaxID=63057 RepID=A0A2P5ERY1_TREOI|nr:hypothetical protein TorRG33x02_158850 [Trema orientale]